jgi:hypothetical protein
LHTDVHLAHHDWLNTAFYDPMTRLQENMERAEYISSHIFNVTGYDVSPSDVRAFDTWHSGRLGERYRTNQLVAGDFEQMQLFWPDAAVDLIATKQGLGSMRMCRKWARRGGWEEEAKHCLKRNCTILSVSGWAPLILGCGAAG